MRLNFHNAHRWTACELSTSGPHGSGSDEAPSTAQLEGRAADWTADAVLRGDASEAIDMLGKVTPDGYTITPEIVGHVQDYINLVLSYGPAQSETSLEWQGVTGRVDSHSVSHGAMLRVFELKYGFTIVEPEENKQLLLAAIALAKPHHETFSLTVFQPRASHPAGPMRRWTIARGVLELWARWFIERIQRTQAPDAIATPGDHCDYCPRRGACHALNASIYKGFQRVRDDRYHGKLSAAQLSEDVKFLDMMADMVKARRSALFAEASTRAKAGEYIPGWGLEPTYKNRRFTVSAETVEFLTGITPFKSDMIPRPSELDEQGWTPKEIAAIAEFAMRSPREMEVAGANKDVIASITKADFKGHELKPYDPKRIARIFK